MQSVLSLDYNLKRLVNNKYSAVKLFFNYSLWVGLIPPISAFFGTYFYGWSFGTSPPISLPLAHAIIIAIFYAFALIIGFLSTAIMLKWMSSIYAKEANLKDCFTLVSVAGTPIVIGGFAHLYPNILFQIIILTPLFAWSAYLLFAAIPILLKTDKDKGFFMGCSILIYLGVVFLSLLGFTTILWVNGIGPNLGI